jgi:excisionase family DNA binding protein
MSATVHNLTDARKRSQDVIDWTEPFITKSELARHMGFSVRWVERRVRDGMPHYRVGGRLRFQKSKAIAWLMEHEEAV